MVRTSTFDSVRQAIGQKWGCEILFLIAKNGPLRYSDIQDEFETSSDVISRRLSELNEYGLIEREETSSREVRYSITSDGKSITELILEIESRLSN